MTAIQVGHPLARVLSIIQIQHGSHGIKTDSIRMVTVCPEHCIGNQEVGYAGTSVVINQRSPVRVCALSRILMLVKAGAVILCHAPGISRKMSRYPVQNHTDSLIVHVIHKIHKIIRCTKTAGRCIVAGHLIAPGRIQRMFHHRHQLHMGITHLFYIGCQLHRNLTVIIKLRANNCFSIFIQRRRFSLPGAQMQLIDRHGFRLRILLCTALHPLFIGPLVFVQIPDHRSRIGAQLRIICIRVNF